MIQLLGMEAKHWPVVKAIYEQGIATGQATFQSEVPEWEEWDSGHLNHSRIVLVENNNVTGWAALTPVSKRAVYAGVAEVSVYLAQEAKGKGLGKKLLEGLVGESEQNGIWALYASIFPENAASIAIHKANGFREIGYRERIAQMNGLWRNTVIFERRSNIVGR
jgi:L-amino acid N-acyltransferase YncA